MTLYSTLLYIYFATAVTNIIKHIPCTHNNFSKVLKQKYSAMKFRLAAIL